MQQTSNLQPFPNLDILETTTTALTDEKILIKKAKGIRRYITDHVTLSDYKNCVEKGYLHKIKQFSITRKHQRLFITGQKKRLLSDLTTKRLFFEQAKLKNFHFSVPLSAKNFFT
jgi:hypothetical protein